MEATTFAAEAEVDENIIIDDGWIIPEDIKIKSANDIVIDAAKDVDIDSGSKIYLN